MYVSIYMYIYIYICIDIYVYIYMYEKTYICIYIGDPRVLSIILTHYLLPKGWTSEKTSTCVDLVSHVEKERF
jgi:hypothetical protein